MKKTIETVMAIIAYVVFLVCASAMDSDCYITVGIVAVIALAYIGVYTSRYGRDYE